MNLRLVPRGAVSLLQCPVLTVCVPTSRIRTDCRYAHTVAKRNISQTSRINNTATLQPPIEQLANSGPPRSPLSRVSTVNLLRSLLLGYTFSSPRLLKLSIWLMSGVVHSRWSFLHPDKNPIVGAVLKTFIYNHFAAGTTPSAVMASVARTKSMGYSGIILGFSREILAEDVAVSNTADAEKKAITSWMEANLDTLKLINSGDHMNLKFTGAGEGTSKALLDGAPPSPELVEAMDTICKQAQAQGSSVWIDAEQVPYQGTVNDWAIQFMRRWNQNGQAVIYNTIQAYLKSSRAYVETHLRAAQAEGWTCAIKLVRGAYIQSDIREAIWDTKPETDNNYNSIVRDLLTKNFAGIQGDSFPDVKLFIAGHNRKSVHLATTLVADLVAKGENIGPVQYGQLTGMADEISCELLDMKAATGNIKGLSEKEAEMRLRATPQPYKCLIWGSVNDCLHFLMRRAVENATAAERLSDGLIEVKKELKRRVLLRS